MPAFHERRMQGATGGIGEAAARAPFGPTRNCIAASESAAAVSGGRLGRAMRGTGGGSASATDVPERTKTGLRSGESAVDSSGGGATPSKV